MTNPATGRPNRSILARLRSLSFTSALARRHKPELRTKATGSKLQNVQELTVDHALARIESLMPDAAWAVYATLPADMKEDIAQRVSTGRWGELFTREIEAQALARDAPSATPKRIHANYFAFRSMTVACPVCGWAGLGAECEVSEMFEGGQLTEYLCPGCSHDLAVATWPTLQDHYDHWDELTESERKYVFFMEGARDERAGAAS